MNFLPLIFALAVVSFLIFRTYNQYRQSKTAAAAAAPLLEQSQQAWICEPELTMPPPRPARFQPNRRMWMIGVFVLFFSAMMAFSSRDYFAVTFGQATPAEVLSIRDYTTTHKGRMTYHYEARVRYAEGEHQGKEADLEMTRTDFEKYKPGDVLTVYVMPYFPDRAAISNSPEVATAPVVLGMLAAIFGLVGVIAWLFYRRMVRFYREGIAVKGRVTSFYKTKNGFVVKVAYEFESQRYEGNALNTQRKAPPTDRWITLLVDARHPKKFMIYLTDDMVTVLP